MTTAYPPAFRADLKEIINGYLVADPYRWLEDPASEQTLDWLTGQDALYAEHMAALPGWEPLAARLTELLDAGTVSTPAWRGTRRFFMRRTPGQEHAVLYTAAASGGERALIDPMRIDPSGSTTLDAWQPDKEGRLLAYQLSEGGERPEGGHEAWFAYTDNTTPAAIYRYDARTGEVGLWERAPGSVDIPDVDTQQVAYQSADGTTVRMLVIAGRQQGREPRPAILTGYGGFGISMLP